jgi:hypothetical protein
MELNPGIHIVMHSVWSLKTGCDRHAQGWRRRRRHDAEDIETAAAKIKNGEGRRRCRDIYGGDLYSRVELRPETKEPLVPGVG